MEQVGLVWILLLSDASNGVSVGQHDAGATREAAHN